MGFHPFGNETTVPPAGWHSEPKFRGTSSILTSSLLTLFLCVYTVVHTNVPEYEEDRKHIAQHKFSRFACRLIAPSKWRRFGWMVMAILAPELVAWNAFEQRRNVKRTTKEVRRSIGDSWTDTHSWFAVMGGYAFDIRDAPEPFFPDGRRRLSITHNGIVAIAQHWPHLLLKHPLTIDQIKDKSKADGLTKFLACWQASWFCVQCIFRLSSGLSISLLELNVFGHAVCALLIYMLWWNKPQDVTEPHVLASEDTFQAAANLCTISDVGLLKGAYPHGGDYAGTVWLSSAKPDPSTIDLSGPVSIPTTSFHPRGSSATWFLKVKIGNACHEFRYYGPARRQLAAIFIDERSFARLRYPYSNSHFDYSPYASVAPRCRDWCISLKDVDIDESGRKATYYLFAITLASAVYGGLHVVASWAPFASPVQHVLWRASSLTVAAFGAAFSAFMLLLPTLEDLPDLLLRPLKIILGWMAIVLICLTLLWYLLCRIYLVVECFISLAYLSESQLAVPSWSLYIPHIS